ncbi:bifunctional tetrahydrofolate synthase/dihydrofolate synthase [Candidatus Profftia sp. (ex Adelges kitamiensis)]|uniref:bifunctional tetrahydrofolate synthase/dihydrofolate synthase n=1 Tax=Candidatus Profftia sp. (ex Adelges kitamiensis) TaxID=2864218 RepID=UPI001CE2F996|nr:bifunctional tetrahydrofolate synthase/dihydrofolate synthase [Candidatus Profftia sp. (ex Adelges kitamiensis)]
MNSFITPQDTSSLNDWLYYIENNNNKIIDLELERVRRVAKKINILKLAPTIFTVAGTNGKGTTCRILETILLAANYRVGVYSSPHILCYTERIRIQGQELTELVHCRSFAALETIRCGIPLTYFEYSTLSALQIFQYYTLDVIILEVGLGGRLDATNILDPTIAIITNVALDHTEQLGLDRDSIGREKAGIFRAGTPAIVGESDMPMALSEVALEKDAILYNCNIDWNFRITDNNWLWYDPRKTWSNLPLPHIPLQNAATALAALRHCKLNIHKKAIIQGLKNCRLPGRFQIFNKKPLLILDVAHNPHAAIYLAERLQKLILKLLNTRKVGLLRAVVGMMKNKDIAGTISCLKPIINQWYCAPLEGVRGAPIEYLIKYLDKPNIFVSIDSAWRKAMHESSPEDIVIVFGSFCTISHVMTALKMEKISDK